jgi:hypothetical protein
MFVNPIPIENFSYQAGRPIAKNHGAEATPSAVSAVAFRRAVLIT